MSRVGKNPVAVPQGVTVALAANQIKVKGKLGELNMALSPMVVVKQQDNSIVVTAANDSKQAKLQWGTTTSRIKNMVKGVTEGYEKNLELQGVGYRAEMKGNTIEMKVGKSHTESLTAPAGIKITVDKQTNVKVSGCDKELVGQVASKLKSFRKPEPYKGKGVRYEGEYIEMKEGKKK